MDALRVENLTYKIGTKSVILDDISFSIQQNDRLAILGSNGSGKTSLIEAILGIIKPTNGHVYFNGKGIKKIGADYGVVWDKFEIFPWLKVKEVLAFFASLRGVNLTNCSIGRILNIDIILDKYMKVLSLGEKKKVAIVIAFMHDPDFLFLDELSSDIDEQTISTLWESYLKYRKTIVFTTHRWSEAEKYATKFLFMKNGHLLFPPSTQEEIHNNFPFDCKIVINDSLDSSVYKEYTNYTYKNQIIILTKKENNDLLRSISMKTNKFTILGVELIDIYNYLVNDEI